MRYKDAPKSSWRVFALIALIIVAIGVSIIVVNSIKHQDERRQVEASLYGYRTNGNIILQDTNGQLWEIDYSDEIDSQSVLRLDVNKYEVERAWVLLKTETVTETGN